MKSPKRYLLVGRAEDAGWLRFMVDSIAALGRLDIVPGNSHWDLLVWDDYRLVMIDASATENAVALVRKVREYAPVTQIVVLTASPTWQSGRDIFHAGANFYIEKPAILEQLSVMFTDVLGCSLIWTTEDR